MLLNFVPILVILAVFAWLAVKAKKLTPVAGFTGWVTGILIFAGAGYTGVAIIAVFFLLGTVATSVGITQKQYLNLAEKNKGQRTSGQVIANAGVAAILGLLILFFPAEAGLLRLMMAASIASAAADTLSSELGNLFGKNYYNITTFKKDQRGLDGIISLEGTLIGIAGSAVIALVYAIGFQFDQGFFLIIIAGTIGNLADSLLGATLERKGYLTNNQVNFLNTLVAALSAFILFRIS